MPKQTTKIPVYFIAHEMYEEYPQNVFLMGKITREEAYNLMDSLSAHHPSKTACIQSANIHFSDWAQFGNKSEKNPRYTALNIDGMFYPDAMPQCEKCKDSDVTKVRCCARNLRKGKCQDKFIKNTLGALLYPKLYGKGK